MSNLDKSLQSTIARIRAIAEAKELERNNAIKKDIRHSITENLVTKSNALTRGFYRFGIVEKRIMESLISQIDPRLFNEYQTQDIELKAVDYAKAFDVSEKVAYRDLASATDALLKQIITVKDGGRIVKRPLMFKAEYKENEGKITASIHPELLPDLIGLREKFTSYPLIKAVEFSSSYTWRMFELIVSWAKPKHLTGGVLAGWFTVEIDQLKKMMGAPKSFQMVHIRERIVERAQKELKEKASIKLNAEFTKTGRKFTHIKFEFIEDEQQKLKLEG